MRTARCRYPCRHITLAGLNTHPYALDDGIDWVVFAYVEQQHIDSAVFSQLVMEGAVGCRTRGRARRGMSGGKGSGRVRTPGGRRLHQYKRLHQQGKSEAQPNKVVHYRVCRAARAAAVASKEAAVEPLLVETNDRMTCS